MCPTNPEPAAAGKGEVYCRYCSHPMSQHYLRSRIPGSKKPPKCYIKLSQDSPVVRDDRDEELAMTSARLHDAEALLERWVDSIGPSLVPELYGDTEAFL